MYLDAVCSPNQTRLPDQAIAVDVTVDGRVLVSTLGPDEPYIKAYQLENLALIWQTRLFWGAKCIKIHENVAFASVPGDGVCVLDLKTGDVLRRYRVVLWGNTHRLVIIPGK